MLKVKWVTWDETDEVELEVAAAILLWRPENTEIFDLAVKTRKWVEDPNFTEVGVCTESLPLARYLATVFVGEVWKISPRKH